MDDPVLVRCPACNFHHWRPAKAVAGMDDMPCHQCKRRLVLRGGNWHSHKDKWGHTIRELVVVRGPPRR